jgi:hypothetical protein
MHKGTIIDDLIASVERVQPDGVHSKITQVKETASLAYDAYIYNFNFRSSKDAVILGVA